IVKDGQHRLLAAETLGLTVYWVEETVDFDVAKVNCAAKVWTTSDYAKKWAANGVKAYLEGLEFADKHSLPLGTAFALLAGTASFGSVRVEFDDGTFKIKDRAWADAVAGIYGPLVQMNHLMKTARLLEACMAVCRVKGFEPKRLLEGAERCREKLV